METARNDAEARLLQRAIDGDSAAFGELYALYLEPMYRYIYYRVSDESQAEDLTEEVFVRAWEKLSSYKPGRHPFSSWLYRIAHNLVIDYQRKRKEDTVEPSLLDERATALPQPEDVLSSAEEAAELARAVAQLDADEQQVVILRFVEGLSHRDVGAIIGKSEGASRMVQHRALEKLHALLSATEKPDG